MHFYNTDKVNDYVNDNVKISAFRNITLHIKTGRGTEVTKTYEI